MLQYVCQMGKVNETKSLKAILARFEETNQALSVVNLVEEFKNEMNRSTVYRILARLEESKVLHSFIGHGGLKWYAKTVACNDDVRKAIHPHFQCEDCGRTECLPIDVPVPKLDNHQIKTVSFLLIGHCGKCS